MYPYEVEFEVAGASDDRIEMAAHAAFGVHLDLVDDSQRVFVPVEAPTANSAVSAARLTLRDLLACLSTGGHAFVEARVMAVRCLDKAHRRPGIETVGGSLTNSGMETIDPTGDLRRHGAILTMSMGPLSVGITRADEELHLFTGRESWPDQVRPELCGTRGPG